MNRATAAGVAIMASAALLTGCAPHTELPAPLTQQQLDAIVAADNDARWSFLFADRTDVVRPQVQRIDYVTPQKAEAIYKNCLSSTGVDLDYVFGFGNYTSDPTGLTAAYLAYYTCVAEYPIDPRAIGYLSAAQLDYMYDYFTERLAPCLRSLGYHVDPAPPRSAFAGTSFNGSAWDPYDDVHPVPGKYSWALIDEQCPPLPAQTYGLRHP